MKWYNPALLPLSQAQIHSILKEFGVVVAEYRVRVVPGNSSFRMAKIKPREKP